MQTQSKMQFITLQSWRRIKLMLQQSISKLVDVKPKQNAVYNTSMLTRTKTLIFAYSNSLGQEIFKIA